MSLDTFANLKTEIAAWLNRSDLVSNIPTFISLAEAEMNLKFIAFNPPLKALEQNTTGTTAATIALPTGYQGTKAFKITTSGSERTLKYIPPQKFAELGAGDRPRYYTIIGSNLCIAYTGTAEAYSWDYYKKLDALSDSITSNWVLANVPGLYLYGALRHAEPFLMNDARIATWQAFFASQMDDLELANTRALQSGSTLQMRSDAAV